MQTQDLLNSILDFGNKVGARDIYLMANEYPIYQIGSESQTYPERTPKIYPDHLKAIIEDTVGRHEPLAESLRKKLFVQFSHILAGIGRYRFQIGYQRSHYDISIRRLLDEIPTLEELKLPVAQEIIPHQHYAEDVREFCRLNNGLVIIAGASDNGKSTTLAALIDYINGSQPGRRITIAESPREFFFRNKLCFIKQKEIGLDVLSYSDAARCALRENTNVLVFGEIFPDDPPAIRAMIRAANSALVFATMHASSASSAINGLIYSLPDVEREESRLTLAQLLQGVIYQVLVKTHEGTLHPCVEILKNNYMISSLIRNKEMTDDQRPFKIDEYLYRNGQTEGMKSLFCALKELADCGIISPDEAISRAREKREMELILVENTLPA